ncbi:helix-turn-helix transcriptional regulator [Myroides indicus]|uniref:HTH araC/xylS-type domain-containing protein n=1 Tax=Myroides indicus TaxID=1323422 RepID=A0A4R7F1L4_9FLAO|nr:hypothetical protein [Myroides indicus]TDS64186.1 hypothetical protein C8P70_10535 [Myroides indicus]
MKLELFEEVQSNFERFVKRFVSLPIKGNPSSLAYQHYHFHYFQAMASIIIDAMTHINYAQLGKEENNIVYSQSFSISLNSQGALKKQIFFDKLDQQSQKSILKTIIQKLDTLQVLNSKNKYQSIRFDCLNRENKLCMICGTLLIDSNSNSYIFDLHYLKIKTDYDDMFLAPDYYLNDKIKLQHIYQSLSEIKSLDETTLLSVLKQNDLAEDDFKANVLYYFGDDFKEYLRKKRLMKSLEMLLFTDNTIFEIADSCGYKSSYPLFRAYYQMHFLQNKALIRYV